MNYQTWWNLTFNLSPDDDEMLEQGAGNFSYFWWWNASANNTLYVVNDIPLSGDSESGILNSTTGYAYFYTDIAANDTGWHQIALTVENTTSGFESQLSCRLYVNFRANGSEYECGVGDGVTIGGPSFPGLDVEGLAAEAGFNVVFIQAFLGTMTVFGLGVMGFAGAKLPGAVLGFGGGLVLVTILGLMPVWGLIVVFFALAGLVVLYATRGRASG